jgi:4'-phosphopantetheinyl transferase
VTSPRDGSVQDHRKERRRANPMHLLLVDIASTLAYLEAEEQRTPRLSADQVARFDQKAGARGSDDARTWRAAHIALRIALEHVTGPAIRCVAYDIEPGGRPVVKYGRSMTAIPQFSLAHAGSTALIVISTSGPVGVDLEVARELNISAERRARIENAARSLAPDAPLPDDLDARFLQCWVRLEAVAKATGLGIGKVLTEAGVVGAAKARASPRSTAHGTVADLDVGVGRFAALSAAKLPQIVAVQDFPADAAAIARFLA